MKPDICIYHGNCADGFTAAWAVWKRWPDIEFAPGIYGEAPPVVGGKNVLMVDFSYKRPLLEAMLEDARTVTILDHHKTAEADLAGLGHHVNADILFDMTKSGAMLAWEFCHGDAAPPRLVQHVQDRDLWQFKLPGTRAIQAAVFSHPYDFQVWEDLAADCEDASSRERLIAEGEAIERKHFKDIAELLAQTTREMVIGGFKVSVANLPYTLASDAANKLAQGAPFGACYFDRNDGKRVFSLRAVDGGEDVSLIAAKFGGGGHAKAAGFQAPAGWEGEAA